MASISAPVRVARPSAGPRRGGGGRWTAWSALLAVLVAIVMPARATARAPRDSARVLLVDAPPTLERALRTALSPWGMQVVVSSGTAEAAALSAHPARAGTLARAHSAIAIIWLDSAGGRRSLRLFDAVRGTSTSREVPAGSIDQALAAALALSIKTLLRGAEATPGSAPAAPESDAPGAVQPPPARPPSEAMPAPDLAQRDAGAAPELARHAPRWQVVALALLRRGALQPDATETRFGAELRWAPELPWTQDLAALWFGARVELGLDREISSPSFRGEYSELGGGVSFGFSRRLSQLFSTGLQLSVSLHSASLEGSLLPDTPLTPETRLGSAIQLRPELGLSLGALGFVVQPALGATLGRQSFVVDGGGQEQQLGTSAAEARVLLETRPVWWMIGVGASVSVE